MSVLGKSILRVLLFEDNNSLRSMLHGLLQNQGWEVISYPDPEQCPLYHAANCACTCDQVCADAIVTDWEMPHVDGFTFVHDLLEKGCRIPHLAMFTGCGDPALLARAEHLGFRVFNKPEDLAALLQWLRNLETQIQAEPHLSPSLKSSPPN